jgi:uncharacterized protein YndB with AHSA1/START domain
MHTIEEDTLTISFERKLRAAPQEVFDAWTLPEKISRWWDPTGAPLTSCKVDLRPGGAFEFVNAGHSPPFSGIYTVVERPTLLVFEALGSVGTVQLTRMDEGTHMRVDIRCASKDHLHHLLTMGVATGTDRTLDNLVRLVDDARSERPVPL